MLIMLFPRENAEIVGNPVFEIAGCSSGSMVKRYWFSLISALYFNSSGSRQRPPANHRPRQSRNARQFPRILEARHISPEIRDHSQWRAPTCFGSASDGLLKWLLVRKGLRYKSSSNFRRSWVDGNDRSSYHDENDCSGKFIDLWLTFPTLFFI